MSYWDETGKYQEAYTELFSKVVPSSGASPFVEGENLRAATKITWDYNNNGFGNNWTGAFNWLVRQDIISREEIAVLGPYANCRSPYERTYGDDDPIVIALNSLMDRVVELLIAKDALNSLEGLTPHTDDMYNYSEKDDYWEEDTDSGDYEDHWDLGEDDEDNR